MDHPVRYQTAYTLPQLELWELDDDQWRKVVERSARSRRCQRPQVGNVLQLPLPLQVAEYLVLVLTYLIRERIGR